MLFEGIRIRKIYMYNGKKEIVLCIWPVLWITFTTS